MGIELAYIAALQRLPAFERAVLVLCDVAGFRAADVGTMLETSEVDAALERARAALGVVRPLPRSPREGDIVARFARAFEAGDVPAITALLSIGALLTVPPSRLTGRAAIARFLAAVPPGSRLLHTRANTQPALAAYVPTGPDGELRACGLLVMTVAGEEIVAITGFREQGLFRHFGLPPTLPVA